MNNMLDDYLRENLFDLRPIRKNPDQSPFDGWREILQTIRAQPNKEDEVLHEQSHSESV